MTDLTASNLFESQTIFADHKDLIHDVAYDFYGERMATCDTTASGSEKGLRQWLKRSNLVDSRTSVTDVKFGPKHLGLLLVTCSADGIIRVNNPPMLAVGSDEPNTTNAVATIHTDKTTANNGKEPVNDIAFAPNLGRAFHLLAVASRDVRIIKLEPLPECANGGGVRFRCEVMAAFEEHASCVWRVAWNTCGTLLASSGDDAAVRTWSSECIHTYFRCEMMAAFEEHASCVWRVAWNTCGTLLASSGDDAAVRTWSIEYIHTYFRCEVMAAFEEHASCVWRVAWNTCGTLLASLRRRGRAHLEQ
ncbi:Sec13-like protein [Operophtera brumata]|uniref:Sec13-like protein n=1 Tax=Operophtera brumata TaxID=104452 RepID=A0A0L7LI96_OPEBR|nr:Sec13-like protein [Operophtera brumata]